MAGASAHQKGGADKERTATKERRRVRTEKRSTALARQRLTLEFSAQAAGRLREMKEMTEATSNAEVIRRSLLLYDWVLSRLRENKRLHLVDETGKAVEVELLLQS
jgi:hypothetical protein